MNRAVVPYDTDKKKEFAYHLLKNPNEPLAVAQKVYPGDMSTAMTVSVAWPNDPEVVVIQQTLLDEYGEEHFLPAKADLAREVWGIAKAGPFVEARDRVKALELYAKVMGHLDESTKISNTNISQNRVMTVPPAESPGAWAKKAQTNQAALIDQTRDVTRGGS